MSDVLLTGLQTVPIKTRLATRTTRQTIEIPERVTSDAFRVVIDADQAVYDDPDFVLTITLQTLDEVTGRTRGAISTHTGPPMGKSGRWALGLKKPPAGLKTTITVSANKPGAFGVELEEDDGNRV